MERKENTEILGAVLSRLKAQKTMRVPFKLPFNETDVEKMLCAAVEQEVIARGKVFKHTESVQAQVGRLAKALTTDEKFGIMLCGTCGNGKSTMMRALQSLLNVLGLRNSYNNRIGLRILDSKQIAHICRSNHDEFLRLCQTELLGIDDMGIESVEVQEFGNVYTPMIDLLTRRYESRLFTFITTNLIPSQIRERYGDRIADRLNEMMEKIIFDNPTFRQ